MRIEQKILSCLLVLHCVAAVANPSTVYFNGDILTVEYLDGKLVMTDNIIGTMTNDPAFSWHLQNIGNYANLSGTDKKPMEFNSQKYFAASSGNGLHGLPGSFLSPDRFIRASMFVINTPAATTDLQERRAWHIMNNFDIPFGAIHLDSSSGYGGGVNAYEFTEWTVVANLKAKTYNIRSFENPSVLSVGFTEADKTVKRCARCHFSTNHEAQLKNV